MGPRTSLDGQKIMSPPGFDPGLHDHPPYLCCPDALSMVGDPLSRNGCGSPNHI